MKPAIADGYAVTIHYRLTLDDGTVADESFGRSPFLYVHGAGDIVPGLERELSGKHVGDECRVTVEAADGYGDYDTKAEQAVARQQFPADANLRPGMSFQADGPQGSVRVWVRSVNDEEVVITTNHPLSGKRLTFDVQVLDVRETNADESREPDG